MLLYHKTKYVEIVKIDSIVPKRNIMTLLTSEHHESYSLSLGSHTIYMYDKAGVRGIHEHIVGGEIGSLEYAPPLPRPPISIH